MNRVAAPRTLRSDALNMIVTGKMGFCPHFGRHD
jgi:hypothetical protein